MRTILTFITVISAAIFVTYGAMATSEPAKGDPVKERKALMKSVGASLGVSVKMIKGTEPYDAAKAAEAMNTIASVPDKFNALLVEGTDSNKVEASEASPKIWEDKAGFEKILNELKTSSAKAANAAKDGQDAFKAVVFGEVTKTCSSCHQAYRVKK